MIDSKLYEQLVNTGSRGKYHALTHKRMERDLPSKAYSNILEVGGGSGQHVDFVECDFDRYECTDLAVPVGLPNKADKRINFAIANVESLQFSDCEFDRVIVTCLLHHLDKPIDALNEIRRVTKNGGLVTILLSSDPGFIFRLVRGLTSDRFLRKNGISNVKLLRAIEHRNHAGSLSSMISGVFSMDRVAKKSFPLKGLSWNFSLFFVFQITIIK